MKKTLEEWLSYRKHHTVSMYVRARQGSQRVVGRPGGEVEAFDEGGDEGPLMASGAQSLCRGKGAPRR